MVVLSVFIYSPAAHIGAKRSQNPNFGALRKVMLINLRMAMFQVEELKRGKFSSQNKTGKKND